MQIDNFECQIDNHKYSIRNIALYCEEQETIHKFHSELRKDYFVNDFEVFLLSGKRERKINPVDNELESDIRFKIERLANE